LQFKGVDTKYAAAETLNLFHFLGAHGAFHARPVYPPPHVRRKYEHAWIRGSRLRLIGTGSTVGGMIKQVSAFDFSRIWNRVKRRSETGEILLATDFIYHNHPAGGCRFENQLKTSAK
jgi:hypothetical protein